MERKFRFTKDTDILDPATLNSIGSATTIVFESDPPVGMLGIAHSLIKVEIMDGVADIPFMAFANCLSLRTVEFQNTLTEIRCGDRAFYNCGIRELRLPACVVLGHQVFMKCGVTKVEIMNGVTNIPEFTFYGCLSLQKVEFPETNTEIRCGDRAFADCGLRELRLRANLVLGRMVFGKCTELTKVEIMDGVANIPEMTFGGCRSLRTVEFPETYTDTKIRCGGSAFSFCGITGLRLPANVLFGDGVFCYCRDLIKVEIMDGVIGIPKRTFLGCRSLESITIPNSVTDIGSQAFKGCLSLESITIPQSVTSIVLDAFTGCPDNMIIYTDNSMKVPRSI